MSDKQRLDQHLVDLGHFQSRARARDAILRATVRVDGRPCNKPAQKVSATSRIEVNDPAASYVSRAALKLLAALDHFDISVTDHICLDIGASTGGFTQVLLERGATRVHAIDVGHDQLHDQLARDSRVIRRDGLNARDLQVSDIGGDKPEIIVSDVSFISLKLALPPALELAATGATGVFLVKPQFEVGRENIGKGGLVDPELGERTAYDIQGWIDDQPGWSTKGLAPSPVKGGDGNAEWLLVANKHA